MKTRIPPQRIVHGRGGRPADDSLAQAFRLHQAGRLEDARRQYEDLLRQRPQDPAVLRLLGAALCQLGEPQAGRDYLRQSLARDPGHVETLLNLGKACGQLKAWEEAAEAFSEAIRLDANHLDAHFCLAGVHADQGRHAQALGHYSQVLALDPQYQAAWRGAGYSAMLMEQADDALAFYTQALKLDPRDSQSLSNRGALLARRGRNAEALQDFSQALEVDPSNAAAWNNQAVALKELGQPEEAIRSVDRAVALDPRYADAWSNRGNIELVLGHPHQALADYERALAYNPKHPDAPFNLSMTLMQVGRLAEGFSLYEVRRQRPGYRLDLPTERLWTGDKPLAGKRLLITMEQGLGDMLQFSRYALLARAHGAQVILQVPRPLLRLLQTLGPDITLVALDEPMPAFDYACPLMSLPHAFRTEMHSIPAPIPYLRADAAQARVWRDRLAAGEEGGAGASALKVGLVWSGGFRQDQPELWAVNQRRNLPLELLAPLKMEGARFISLQKGADSEAQLHALQAQGWSGPSIEDHTALLGDFADTAALVDNLDLVISVDTSTAHLAAAMGKPTWIFSRLDGCWRWLEGRGDSPWYPTVRLYRQARPYDWAPVVERVRQDLALQVARHAATAPSSHEASA